MALASVNFSLAGVMGACASNLSSNSPLLSAQDEFEFNLAFSVSSVSSEEGTEEAEEAPTFGRGSSLIPRKSSDFLHDLLNKDFDIG